MSIIPGINRLRFLDNEDIAKKLKRCATNEHWIGVSNAQDQDEPIMVTLEYMATGSQKEPDVKFNYCPKCGMELIWPEQE